MPLLLGLHPLDAAIIVASLLAVIGIGVHASRNVHGESDFFVSGRSMGAWLQFFINFGQATDSNAAPTIATEVFRAGASGMWIGFQTLLATPFVWFTAVWFRRARVITGPDLFLDRFGSRRLGRYFAWFGLLTIPLQLGLGNIVSYKVAAATMVKPESVYTQADRAHVDQYHAYQRLRGRAGAVADLSAADRQELDRLDTLVKRGRIGPDVTYLSPLPFYLGYTLIVASYILLGGIKAAAVTDAFQGLLIIVFSVIMVPLGLRAVGGFAGLHASVPETHFSLFDGAGDYTWYSIAAIAFTSLIVYGAPGNPSVAAARDERAIRTGMLSGLFCKRFVMIAWMMCGLLAASLFAAGGLADADNAWGSLAVRLLPPGLMGMMIAGMLLGHMPAVGTQAITFSATFTRNLYEPARPGRPEGHYLTVAKLSTLGVLLLGALFATFFSSVIALLTALITFNAYFGVVGLLLYFWRHLTAYAVGIGAGVWVLLMVVAAYLLPLSPGFARLPELTRRTTPYATTVVLPATQDDVSAGRAVRAGEPLRRQRVTQPVAMFFESVVLSNPSDPNSPHEGVGRFQVENYLLWRSGLPLERLGSAGLITCRWLFDGVLPFLLLIPLSYATLRREDRQPDEAAGTIDAERPAGRDPFSVASLPLVGRPGQTPRAVRIDRFYAKMKTPIAPTLEGDQAEVARSFADPSRFDHLKLFGPRSSWEFARWDRADYFGFFGCWAGVGVVLAVLLALLKYGTGG